MVPGSIMLPAYTHRSNKCVNAQKKKNSPCCHALFINLIMDTKGGGGGGGGGRGHWGSINR